MLGEASRRWPQHALSGAGAAPSGRWGIGVPLHRLAALLWTGVEDGHGLVQAGGYRIPRQGRTGEVAVIEGLVVNLDTMYVIALVVLPPVGMDMLPMGGERCAKGNVHDRRPFLGTRRDARHDGFVKG